MTVENMKERIENVERQIDFKTENNKSSRITEEIAFWGATLRPKVPTKKTHSVLFRSSEKLVDFKQKLTKRKFPQSANQLKWTIE